MNELRVAICKENICSCNSCGAKNYKSEYDPHGEPTQLWDVKIGMMSSRLCRNCLHQLIGAAVTATAMEDGK